MNEFPLTIRRSIELLGLVAAGFIVAAGRSVLMPLLVAFFVSLLLLPLFRWFRRLGIPEVVAIVLPILCVTLLAGAVGWLFYGQLVSLISDMPAIAQHVTQLLDRMSIWVSRVFGYSPDEQLKIIDQNSNRLTGYAEGAVKQLAGSLSAGFIFFGLLPVYTFFIHRVVRSFARPIRKICGNKYRFHILTFR